MLHSLTNQLLIAMPRLKNTAFNKSVIYICHHDQNGAMGLIVNHPINEKLKKVFEELDIDHKETHHSILETPIHIGGPIKVDNIFVLHKVIDGIDYDNTISAGNGIAVTTSIDILEDIAANEPPDHFLIIAGYSNWDKDQLTNEIKNNDWVSSDMEQKTLFDIKNNMKWSNCMQSIGVKNPAQISKVYGNA